MPLVAEKQWGDVFKWDRRFVVLDITSVVVKVGALIVAGVVVLGIGLLLVELRRVRRV